MSFFFFFFNGLYNIIDIQIAFKKILVNKMLLDGYYDMNKYICKNINKNDMYEKLKKKNSKYIVLYEKAYPAKDDATTFWYQNIKTLNNGYIDVENITNEDAEAIVKWVYQILRKQSEREEFTKAIFTKIKDFYGIKNEIAIENGVVYNKSKVELKFFSSISEISSFIMLLPKKEGKTIFFRGHENMNYLLCPSILRTTNLKNNERNLYNDMIINCPHEFEKCKSHLEKLVKMQHYGLPTRLLDITRNMLVALFFACESQTNTYGELIIIEEDTTKIKYPQSDTVSILASLPLFSREKQEEFNNVASNREVTQKEFNTRVNRLIHEVRLEKPAFKPEIEKETIINNYVVYALKNNSRIIKQDGAFIICGLDAENGTLNKFRYSKDDKNIIILIEDKKKIISELDNYSINRASLFPEIEGVSQYLVKKYS